VEPLIDALYQAAGTLTYAVMTGHRAGHLSLHMRNEMTGSVAGHDGAGVKSHPFRRLALCEIVWRSGRVWNLHAGQPHARKRRRRVQ
jgi:hypothetical protein